jgi:hypothetical protein
MPLPGIENDGAKRFHHSSFVIRHLSFVIGSAGVAGYGVFGVGCGLFDTLQ